MSAIISVFTGLFTLLAQSIIGLHNATAKVFGERSGWGWLFAIVLLTVCVRLLLFPIFVKQIKTQRAMQELQPKIKALQARHKGDRETLNTELMKLYKEHGANPLAGCLPLLLQMPIFIGMFRVLRNVGPTFDEVTKTYRFPDGNYGVSRAVAENLGKAKVLGAPIGAAFSSPGSLLRFLGTTSGAVKAVCGALMLFMVITQFLTSRQMMAKNKPTDPQQVMQQKVLLYVMPLMLGLFGFSVPLGVLVYWTTSNLWSMGQQHFIITKMPQDPVPGNGKVVEGKVVEDKPPPKAATSDDGETPALGAAKAGPPKSVPNRNRSKKKGRKGGRR